MEQHSETTQTAGEVAAYLTWHFPANFPIRSNRRTTPMARHGMSHLTTPAKIQFLVAEDGENGTVNKRFVHQTPDTSKNIVRNVIEGGRGVLRRAMGADGS